MTTETEVPRPDGPLSDEQRALATVCAHYFAVFALASGLLKWASVQTSGELAFNFADQVCVVALAASLMLGTTTRSGLVSRERAIALTPVLLVVGALPIALVEQWQPWPQGTLTVGISWVCLWIVGFPNAGPKITGSLPYLAAACAVPLVTASGVLLGVHDAPSAAQAALFIVPPFIAAAAVSAPVERIVTQRDEDRIGSFRLLEPMGGGGMGEVWKAEHRMLATPAAVKLIRPEALSSGSGPGSDVEERFRREAQATSELRSPHTVRLFDFGLDSQGRCFYVMELLEGLDMELLVANFGPVPPERCVHLLAQACLSLAEAHGRGMVHRDIKPANLLVTRLGVQVDFVKVVDFGLVAVAEALPQVPETAVSNSKLTAVGTVAGTPAYMSPEAATGAEIDHRADLYALGCVAVWLLCGELVFTGSAKQVLLAHAHKAPQAPSLRTELPIPADLEAVVMALLLKDPAQRPQSAEELLMRLHACECAGTWTAERARTWWARNLP